MHSYCSYTGNRQTQAMLLQHSWRLMICPDNPYCPADFRYALDNGAWSDYTRGQPFSEARYARLIDLLGENADFIVLPDIVGGGQQSLQKSLFWIEALKDKPCLLPVQDGMGFKEIAVVLKAYPNVGLFLGGTTEWKMKTAVRWGRLALKFNRPYHFARANSRMRICFAFASGAQSFDGSGAVRFPQRDIPVLTRARDFPWLITIRPESV